MDAAGAGPAAFFALEFPHEPDANDDKCRHHSLASHQRLHLLLMSGKTYLPLEPPRGRTNNSVASTAEGNR